MTAVLNTQKLNSDLKSSELKKTSQKPKSGYKAQKLKK